LKYGPKSHVLSLFRRHLAVLSAQVVGGLVQTPVFQRISTKISPQNRKYQAKKHDGSDSSPNCQIFQIREKSLLGRVCSLKISKMAETGQVNCQIEAAVQKMTLTLICGLLFAVGGRLI
jgi:hypothetical protein